MSQDVSFFSISIITVFSALHGDMVVFMNNSKGELKMRLCLTGSDACGSQLDQ